MKITLALTGASGMLYGVRLIQELLKLKINLNIIISRDGIITMHQELGISLSSKPQIIKAKLIEALNLNNHECLSVYGNNDWYAPFASGSNVSDAMVVCPCSMASLARIAHGLGDDLISRSADVIIKERKNLILVPRETPFSAIHLENMLILARLNVSIIPPMPAFYTHPQTILDMVNFVVSRIMDQLGIDNQLAKRWEEQ